jgi:predicted aldo/keto reductase-like oxidoreductase
MQYRNFGRSGRKVSILGFGAMRVPTHEDRTANLELAVPLLRRGLELGITYIDTAHVYCEGTSEVAVGQAVKGFDRSQITITTKVGAGDEEKAGYASWSQRLELSLKRLDTHIDYILFHGLRWDIFEKWVSQAGWALDAARKAQAEGLVKHIGFSSHDTAENIIRLIDTGEFDVVLMQYNYLDRHNESAIARAHERGLGVSIMGPVAGGRLAVPGGVLVDSEGALEMKTPELALRYVWDNPGVSVALSGMRELEQVEENVASANRMETLSPSEQGQIRQLIEKNQKLADLYCTGCSYCLPCPNEVQIPENFRYMNWYRVWGMEEAAKKAYAALSPQGSWTPYAGLVQGKKAEDCLACGECEIKCPQNIPIVEQLQEVARVLGR